MSRAWWDQRPPRRPRNHGVGGKLTILKGGRLNRWQVLYVSEVDANHVVWSAPIRDVTSNALDGPTFPTWQEAMDHAATLRTWYGDQCRGDNLLWDRKHGRNP